MHFLKPSIFGNLLIRLLSYTFSLVQSGNIVHDHSYDIVIVYNKNVSDAVPLYEWSNVWNAMLEWVRNYYDFPDGYTGSYTRFAVLGCASDTSEDDNSMKPTRLLEDFGKSVNNKKKSEIVTEAQISVYNETKKKYKFDNDVGCMRSIVEKVLDPKEKDRTNENVVFYVHHCMFQNENEKLKEAMAALLGKCKVFMFICIYDPKATNKLDGMLKWLPHESFFYVYDDNGQVLPKVLNGRLMSQVGNQRCAEKSDTANVGSHTSTWMESVVLVTFSLRTIFL